MKEHRLEIIQSFPDSNPGKVLQNGSTVLTTVKEDGKVIYQEQGKVSVPAVNQVIEWSQDRALRAVCDASSQPIYPEFQLLVKRLVKAQLDAELTKAVRSFDSAIGEKSS